MPLQATAEVALFSLGFSLYLYFSLSFYFFYCSLIYGRKFLFLLLACLWVWGFGFFLGFNDFEKGGILIWVWGCKKEMIFVSSFGCSKGWIFGLGVAMFLCWDFGASGFLWLDVCALCWQWCWWLVLSFEAPAMGIMGLIRRWRDWVRREEKERGDA